MKAFAAFALLLLIPAQVAPDRPGRVVDIQLADGSTRNCILYGYDAQTGEFQLQQNGQDQTLKLDQVKSIKFGDAVGKNVRLFEPPEQPGPENVPFAEMSPAMKQRLTEEFYRTPMRRRAMALLWRLTDQFHNKDAIQAFDADLPAHIKLAHEGGQLEQEKTFRQALAVLKVAQQQPEQARQVLDALKADFPNDPFIQRLTLQGLTDRLQEMEPMRRPLRDRPRMPDSRPSDSPRPSDAPRSPDR